MPILHFWKWCHRTMKFVLRPWHLFVFIIAGLINRQQQQVIELQNAQIRILMNTLGKKRILLTDGQRRMLAVKGKAFGLKALCELTTVVTPDTPLLHGWDDLRQDRPPASQEPESERQSRRMFPIHEIRLSRPYFLLWTAVD